MRIVSLFPGIPSAATACCSPEAITLCVSLSQMALVDTIQGFRWGTVTRVRLTLRMKKCPFHSNFLDNKEWERVGKKIKEGTEYIAVTEVFLKKKLLWTFSSEEFLPTWGGCWVDRMGNMNSLRIRWCSAKAIKTVWEWSGLVTTKITIVHSSRLEEQFDPLLAQG